MKVTVGICTWNRANLLKQCLDRFTSIKVPVGLDWELVVVNNNCTDTTDEVIESYLGRLPIRRLFEPKQGKSYACNLAVNEASGEYMLWTDDDVLVDEEWLSAYARAFERWPQAAFFGGPVKPWFEKQPPVWLRRVWPRLSGVYAMRDLGNDPITFEGGNSIPYGANWAVRLKEQRQYPYDTRLGPQPGSSVRGEETKVASALLSAGYEGRWVPDATVHHYVPAERMTIRYVKNWWVGEGRGHALIALPWEGPMLLGKPRHLWRQVATARVKYLMARLVSRPEVWIGHLIEASIAWGQFRAYSAKKQAGNVIPANTGPLKCD